MEAQFWLNLQLAWDLYKVKHSSSVFTHDQTWTSTHAGSWSLPSPPCSFLLSIHEPNWLSTKDWLSQI
jgi:hypothetical protein